MFTEFFLKNAFNLAILFSCGMALLVVRFWLSRNVQWKKGFTFHAAQFFIYAIIIGTIGSILNNAIEDYNLRFISSGVIDFICTSLIALILTIKLFLIINQFEKAQVNKGRDVTSTRILARVIKITIIVAIVLLYGEHFGMSLSGLLTFGGIGGIAVGMAGKDVLSNFSPVLCSISIAPSVSETGFVLLTEISKVRSPKSAGELHELTHSTTARCTCLIPSFHPLALRIRDG